MLKLESLVATLFISEPTVASARVQNRGLKTGLIPEGVCATSFGVLELHPATGVTITLFVLGTDVIRGQEQAPRACSRPMNMGPDQGPERLVDNHGSTQI